MKTHYREIILQTLMYLAIAILINAIASNWFIRLDMTSGKINTLSRATESLLRSLKDKMIARVYYNSDLPAPYNNDRRALIDMLDELRSYSRGKLEYELIDPKTEAEANKATQEGIPQVQVQVINNDKLEVKRAFMGIVLEYRAHKEVIPVIQNMGTLEYEIASRVDQMLNTHKKTIAISQGHGEPSFEDIDKAQKALSLRYYLLPTDLSRPVPDSVSALIMIQPVTPLADSQKYNLDQFMMRRGRAGFMMSMVNATLQSSFAQDLSLNLSSLFKNYGFEIRKDLVRDAVCASVTVMQREGGLAIQTEIPHPYIPIVSNLNRNFVVTQNLHQLILPFPSSIDTTEGHSFGLNIIPIAVSSEQSGIQTGFYVLDPAARYTREMFTDHFVLLSASLSGNIHSAFPDTSIYARSDPSYKSTGTERVVVIGDGNFIRDTYLQNPENLSFFLNTVDYLTDDLGLISIRSKSFLPSPLKPVSETSRSTIKYFIILFPPLIIVAGGLGYWKKTVNRRRAYIEQISGLKEEKQDEQVD
ncbi:MAG: GldG family protein [Candidatus Kryptoniota bacterium]